MALCRSKSAVRSSLGIVLAVVGIAAAPMPPVSPPPAPLTVYAAASLTDAFQELGRAFEATHAGMTVQFNFAGSQQLASQLEQGAPADVFASADKRWMSYAVEKGLVEGEPTIFAGNRLVVIVPRTNPARIGRLQDLVRRGTKIVVAGRRYRPGSTAGKRWRIWRAPPASRPSTTAAFWPTWSHRRRT